MKNLSHSDPNVSRKRKKVLVPLSKTALIAIMMLLTVANLEAQSLVGSTWDLATSTASSGYKNWGSGVISLTDTTTGSGTCQGSAVTETSGYNPATDFSLCFRVFFGCPGNDQIGTIAFPYTDLNGDGMAFSFWKNNAIYTATNANTCGGGLGYHNALTGGANDGKMITIEFDTYSSLGTSGVDGYYGGGPPGSGINDEISLHKDQNSGDAGLITTTAATNVNAGNLEDGLQHDVCISYSATSHILTVTLDGVTKLSYDLGATYNLNTYFGGTTLNYTWSAGKYGSNNLQTIGPAGSNIFAAIGRNPCTGVLPVNLLTFTGEKKNGTSILSWATATELNNKKFIIERSSGLSDWETIGEVAGAGNSVSILDYSFTDYAAPLDGKAYYRLRQIDINGAFDYSSVIVVQTEEQSVSITPNPFEDVLIIKNNVQGDMDISIHDVLGRVLYHNHINKKSDNGMLSIQPDLSSGAYLITIRTDTFIEQQKIIKK